MNPEDDPLEQLKALKQHSAAQPDPLDELKRLKASGGRPKLGQMGIPISDESPEEPDYNTKSLGALASLARDIPGGEALEAGARSLFRAHPSGKRNKLGFVPTTRDQSYGEALSDIRTAEESAPLAARVIPRVAGGTVAAAVAPGKTALRQGAIFGAASGAGRAEPVPLGDRVGSTIKEGAVGATAGKLFGELAPLAFRAGRIASLGKVALRRDAQLATADASNYGKAALEGDLAAGNPTPQAVTAALDEPDIKPYVKIVRNSRTLKGANDATVLREAYKLMSEHQATLTRRALNSDDFKAGTELEKADIGAAKRHLLSAADQIMPSFRPAVYEHADLSREREAFRSGADATNRIIRGVDGSARRLSKNSAESFLNEILSMTPEEASAATEGALGRAKGKSHLSLNPFKAFGVPKAAKNYSRIAELIDALDRRAGNTSYPPLGRALAIALGETGTR